MDKIIAIGKISNEINPQYLKNDLENGLYTIGVKFKEVKGKEINSIKERERIDEEMAKIVKIISDTMLKCPEFTGLIQKKNYEKCKTPNHFFQMYTMTFKVGS